MIYINEDELLNEKELCEKLLEMFYCNNVTFIKDYSDAEIRAFLHGYLFKLEKVLKGEEKNDD